MSSNNIIFYDFSGDFNTSLFGNFNDEGCNYDIDHSNDYLVRFNAKNNIQSAGGVDEIAVKIYPHYQNYKFDEQDNEKDSSKAEDSCDNISVTCENEFDEKVALRRSSHETNSTVEIDASSTQTGRKGYQDLFTMFEDKNTYKIGHSSDEVSTDNNAELLKLDRIISDEYTDMNIFIGDMLKNCPCDNLIKKQRIYKAKNIKRKRKSKDQIQVLERELLINPNWDKDDIKRLSRTLDLNRDQVYKWYWDQKKKTDM